MILLLVINVTKSKSILEVEISKPNKSITPDNALTTKKEIQLI